LFIFTLVYKNIDIKVRRTVILPGFVRVWNLVSHINIHIVREQVLKKILGTNREKVRRNWRKFHYDELHDLYFSENVITKFKGTRWRGTSRICEKKNEYRVWVGILKERDHLEELGAGGKTILKWILHTKHRMALNKLCH